MFTKQSLLVIALLGLTLSSSYADDCSPHDGSKCECAYNDGSGYSLKTLVNENDGHIDTMTVNNLIFFFSPCSNSKKLPDLNSTTNECKDGYSLCAYDSGSKKFTLLGKQEDAGFQEDSKQKLSMTFVKYNASVTLECAQFVDPSVLYPNDSTVSEAHLILFSPLACVTEIYEVKQPGFFSTFFLVLFIMFLLYIVFGMLYQYFIVGARGFEILPNYDFWSKVWISIKLGFLYIKNGCRVIPAPDSYDAI